MSFRCWIWTDPIRLARLSAKREAEGTLFADETIRFHLIRWPILPKNIKSFGLSLREREEMEDSLLPGIHRNNSTFPELIKVAERSVAPREESTEWKSRCHGCWVHNRVWRKFDGNSAEKEIVSNVIKSCVTRRDDTLIRPTLLYERRARFDSSVRSRTCDVCVGCLSQPFA